VQRLAAAVREGERLRMIYASVSSGGETMRRVDPYSLFFQDGALYFAAFDERRREVRTFAVHRVRALTSTGERFKRPDDFRLDRYLGSSFRIIRGGAPVEVTVRLSARAAQQAEGRRWHPSQALTRRADGSIDLSMRVSSLDEVSSWLLSFGGEARALSPPALLDLVRAASRRIASQHDAVAPEVSQFQAMASALPGRSRTARRLGPKQEKKRT
jgi:predicted DNA-binding transcriptional regulator YafY